MQRMREFHSEIWRKESISTGEQGVQDDDGQGDEEEVDGALERPDHAMHQAMNNRGLGQDDQEEENQECSHMASILSSGVRQLRSFR